MEYISGSNVVPGSAGKYKVGFQVLDEENIERPRKMTGRFSWTLPALLSLGLVLLTWPLHGSTFSIPRQREVQADPPRQSNNLTNVVQWDNYSLFVNNQRIFL